MTTPTIEGQGNLPARPTLAYPNRVDLRVVQAIEQAMGGRIAWLVERSCMPGADIMEYLRSQRAAGILADLAAMSREILSDRILDKLSAGFHVVLLTGRPSQAKGTLCNVPSRLLSCLDDTTLPILPIYAGYSADEPEAALPTDAAEAALYLRFMPQQREGKALGARVRAAWMEASAEHLSAHPLLREASLPRMLVTALMRHQDARIIDGVDDSSLTYRNLLALALMLAGYLRRQTKDKRLGIILPPGKLSAIANLACLFAGISPLNLNYSLDRENVLREIRHTGVNRFLTEERFRRKLQQFAWPNSRDLIYVDRELTEMGRGPFTFWRALVRFGTPARILRRLHLPDSTPEAEAALLFTSGIEGTPKAVPMSHRMLAASLLQLQNRLEMQPRHRVLSALPAFYPLGFVHGLLLPLFFGYDMVTYPSHQSAKRLATLVAQNKVRLAAMHQTMAAALLRAGSKDGLSTLRYFMVGGTALPEALVQKAHQHRHVQLLSAYSLTEAAPMAALNLPSQEGGNVEAEGTLPPEIPAHRPGSVGAPLPGIAVRITDVAREGRQLPPGMNGLIWLKGANIAPRSLNDSEGALRGQWYCTGDVGYVDEEGMLTISGRAMRFSNIGGELVPHEKLEEVLAKMYKVENTEGIKLAIVAVPDPREGEQLILLSSVHKTNADYRYTTMRYNLMNAGYPEQWTPKKLIPLPYIPALPNGKLNYPLCFMGVCKQLGIPLPGQED